MKFYKRILLASSFPINCGPNSSSSASTFADVLATDAAMAILVVRRHGPSLILRKCRLNLKLSPETETFLWCGLFLKPKTKTN